MAATGHTPIYLYYSSTAAATPSAGNLGYGELALNITDKNLFFKDNTNTVNTVPIRQASGSSSGWLSSTDWTTFNNKQPAGTYVTSVSGTAPVVSSGGTTPAISMAAATSSANGYLTSTDWTTFNGKQAALVSGTNIKTVSGTTLLGSGDLGTIGTGYGGTGLTSFTANGVVYASSTSALATGSGLQFNGSNLGINVAPSAWRSDYKAVTVNDTSVYSSTAANDRGIANNCYANSAGDYIYVNNGYASRVILAYNGQFYYQRAASGTAGGTVSFTNAFIVDDSNNVQVPAGNLVIGTSGKGIDFSATPGTGTSELLADYEEGTFTATLAGSTSGATGAVTSTAYYTKVGRQVVISATFNAVTMTGATGNLIMTGLPYTSNSSNPNNIGSSLLAGFPTAVAPIGVLGSSSTQIAFYNSSGGSPVSAVSGAGLYAFMTLTYIV